MNAVQLKTFWRPKTSVKAKSQHVARRLAVVVRFCLGIEAGGKMTIMIIDRIITTGFSFFSLGRLQLKGKPGLRGCPCVTVSG